MTSVSSFFPYLDFFIYLFFTRVSSIFVFFKNVEAKMPLFMKQKETQAMI